MSQLIRLRGRSALSAHRQQQLLKSISAIIPGLHVAADYWHFVSTSLPLEKDEAARLERILTYGPVAGDVRRRWFRTVLGRKTP